MRRLSTLLLLLAAAPLTAAEPADFFFKPHDRVLFLGDSITEQYQYSSAIELYLTTRFPGWDCQFLNAGIGGDTATGGARRFASHVLAEKPTAITIDFGMNDGGYGKFDETKAANFLRNTEAMLKAAEKAGVRVALISPNAVEVRNRASNAVYLETQKQFYAPLAELAAKYHVPFVDQYAVTRRTLEKMAADNAPVKAFPDSVHTGPAGALLMAHTILVGLKAPAVVSDLTIDAGSKEAKGQRCRAAVGEAGSHGVTFERTDEALPLPVGPDWQPMLPYVNQLKDLNYYGLKVTGLGAGKYSLTIDGQDVGSYTAGDLAEGVNLGNVTKGPVYEQGQKVFAAINDKNDIIHKRFRGVVMFDVPNWIPNGAEVKAKELAKRSEVIAAKQAEVYKLAQPVPHKFVLRAE
jgi:lysophospholipase L1-like esterase